MGQAKARREAGLGPRGRRFLFFFFSVDPMLKKVLGFIGKNWRELLLFAAAGVIMLTVQALDRGNGDAIAAMMADQSVKQFRARDAKIVARYAPLIAAKDAELAAIRSAEAAAVSRVGERDRQLARERAKVKTLADCRTMLAERDAQLKQQAEDHDDRFQSLDTTWGDKFALRVRQDAERLDAAVTRIGQLAQDNARLQLRARAKLIIGPQVGYGPGGAYIGVGATYEVVRIRWPW